MFMLIETADRTSEIEYFKTKREAMKVLKEHFLEATDCNTIEEVEQNGYDCSFDGDCAWLNDGPNHEDFDWSIIKLPSEDNFGTAIADKYEPKDFTEHIRAFLDEKASEEEIKAAGVFLKGLYNLAVKYV